MAEGYLNNLNVFTETKEYAFDNNGYANADKNGCIAIGCFEPGLWAGISVTYANNMNHALLSRPDYKNTTHTITVYWLRYQ